MKDSANIARINNISYIAVFRVGWQYIVMCYCLTLSHCSVHCLAILGSWLVFVLTVLYAVWFRGCFWHWQTLMTYYQQLRLQLKLKEIVLLLVLEDNMQFSHTVVKECQLLDKLNEISVNGSYHSDTTGRSWTIVLTVIYILLILISWQ